MIEIRDKQILVDGKPVLIISGEVHYYRLQRDEWQDRIDKLKASGCNAVASYIPWLCHEPVEGQFDFGGKTHPQLDLGGFIDLCRDNGLYFVARPGPFIMAEMKNEGLPYWVYTKHPEIIPVTWDSKLAPTRTVDYLAPGFLEEARHWYDAVMKVLVPRLQPNGGNIIGVQLDNEIGMLSWVSNSPDLTDNLLAHFTEWLHGRYSAEELKLRYPFSLEVREVRDAALRSPREEYAASFMRDLGYYMRYRFAKYVAVLREYAEANGVHGVPLIINIHGTDQGRGFTYPIGISQLYEAYTQDAVYLAGSDHYIGNLDGDNFQDMYLINALMEALNLPDQPLTSVEFECGSGDYGGASGKRYDPSAVSHKTRMCIAQGNRLLNYYLFTGGINYLLDEPVHDGNDRISFTGERHGTAAPVNPEGRLNYSYEPLKQVVTTMMAVGDKLATMYEERDSVAFAIVPDYYMTESHYPSSVQMSALVGNIGANRGPNAWENVARTMLYAGYRFTGVDVQNRDLLPETTPVVVLPSALYMDGAVQEKLASYLHAGGKMLLYGELATFDMEAKPCIVLANALGLRTGKIRQATSFYYLSIQADGWAAPMPEIRTHHTQALIPERGEVLLRVVGEDEVCGVEIEAGSGRAIVITGAYPAGVDFYRKALERLGAYAGLRHDCEQYGIFMTSTRNNDGERLIHILNLDGFEKRFHVTEGGKRLLGGHEIVLAPYAGLMLPVGVRLGDATVAYSTAEITGVEHGEIRFRLTQPQDVIAIQTNRDLVPGDDFTSERRDGLLLVTSRKHAAVENNLSLRLA